LSSSGATVPLKLYYNAARNDHMTVASFESIQYCEQNGYTLLNAALGYVYASQPSRSSSSSRRSGSRGGSKGASAQRLAYSSELLKNAFN
jgi:hypothetical protein